LISARLGRAICAAVAAAFVTALGACSLAWNDEDLQNGMCPADRKVCDDQCQPVNRSNLGCARPGCAPCSLPHAVAVCSLDGQCAIGTCQNEYRDCDPAQAGCETDTDHDPDNCGDCNRVCGDVPNAVRGCTSGNCTVGGCSPGFKDCNKKYADGCELDVTSDPDNCGDCGAPCGMGLQCVGSVCQ
jgi:hypothetical protein